MPNVPPKKCASPGCAAASKAGELHCPKHAGERRKARAERQAEGQSFYQSTVWKRLRKIVLNEEPLCRACMARSIVNPANEVDHIDGDFTNNERANLQPLCKSCHSQKTVRENRGFGQ